jgi:hypothetical protein
MLRNEQLYAHQYHRVLHQKQKATELTTVFNVSCTSLQAVGSQGRLRDNHQSLCAALNFLAVPPYTTILLSCDMYRSRLRYCLPFRTCSLSLHTAVDFLRMPFRILPRVTQTPMPIPSRIQVASTLMPAATRLCFRHLFVSFAISCGRTIHRSEPLSVWWRHTFEHQAAIPTTQG